MRCFCSKLLCLNAYNIMYSLLFSLGQFKEGAVRHPRGSFHPYPPDINRVILDENDIQNYTINIILIAVGWQTFKCSLCLLLHNHLLPNHLLHNHLLHNLHVKHEDGQVKPCLVGNLCPQTAEVIKYNLYKLYNF